MLGNACAILAFDECAVVVLADVDPVSCPRVREVLPSQLFTPCIVLRLMVAVMVTVALLLCRFVTMSVGPVCNVAFTWRPRLSLNTFFRKSVGWTDSGQRESASVCMLRRVACAIVLVPACAVVVTFVLKNTRRKILEPRSHRGRDIQQRN